MKLLISGCKFFSQFVFISWFIFQSVSIIFIRFLCVFSPQSVQIYFVLHFFFGKKFLPWIRILKYF